MESNASGMPGDEMQFDRVERSSAEAPAGNGVVCTNCSSKIETAYFNVGSDPFCARCKSALQAQIEPEKSFSALGRALGLGFVAAIAGAIVYYGVIAITNFEIGIVAILIGFMVGWAVRRGASGRGGRRFQVMAVALTYFSVGLAYFPMALKSFEKNEKQAMQSDTTAASQSTVKAATSTDPPSAAIAVDSSANPAAADVTADSPGVVLAVFMLIGLSLMLPVLVVAGSMPSGLISALIILIGMRQAWVMTGVPQIAITGPFRVGPRAPTSST